MRDQGTRESEDRALTEALCEANRINGGKWTAAQASDFLAKEREEDAELAFQILLDMIGKTSAADLRLAVLTALAGAGMATRTADRIYALLITSTLGDGGHGAMPDPGDEDRS